MKSYNPCIHYGTHTVEVTLQQWEYVGHITQRISGNCKGKDVLDFDFDCEDGNLENDCNLKCDEKYGYFSAILKNSEGDTLEVEGDASDFNRMIVKVEIIDFQKDKAGGLHEYMNREILFRGKRTDNGKWVEGFYVKFYGNGNSNPNYMIFTTDEQDKSSQPYAVNPETVCQYTDWGNENDGKIFEGDIIKVDDLWIGIVVWDFNDTSFNVEPVYDDMEEVERLGVVINGNYVEVIGNIFDNPELLKECRFSSVCAERNNIE